MSLFSAYGTAGKTSGAYSRSLQTMMDFDEEKRISRETYLGEQESSDRKFAAIQQGLGLVSTVASGAQTQKTAESDIARHTGGKAEQTVGETSIIDLVNPFKRGEEGKIEWEGFGKAPGLGKGETAWGEVSEKLGVMFGGKERMWEWEGKEYKQSDLLSGAKLGTIEDIAGESETMAQEVEIDDETGEEEDKKTGTFSGPGGKGTVEEIYDPIKGTWSEP